LDKVGFWDFVEKMRNGGRKWLGGGLERPAVVSRWWWEGWVAVGVVFGWCLGEEARRWEEERVYGGWKMGKSGKESDLKAGHVRPKNECVERT
jgi:hypothetical protein